MRTQIRTTGLRTAIVRNDTNADIKLLGFETLLPAEDAPSVLFGVDLGASECQPNRVLEAGASCDIALTFSPVVHQSLPAESGDDADFSSGRLQVEFAVGDGVSQTKELALVGRGRLSCTLHEDAIALDSDEWQARYLETKGPADPASPTQLRRQALTEAERARFEASIRDVLVPWLNTETGYAMDPNTVHVLGPGGLTDQIDERIEGAMFDAEEPADSGLRILGMAFEVEREMNADGSFKWVYSPNGTDCVMHFPSAVSSLSIADQLSNRAHELFHCYQYRFWDVPSRQYPDWLAEGTAAYVEELALDEGTTHGPRRFDAYIGRSEELFERDYDAMPFFHHVQLTGANVLSRTPQWVEPDSAVLFDQIVGPLDGRAMYAWASGMWEDPALGPDWDTSIPATPDASVQTPKIVVDASAMGGQRTIPLPQVSPTHIEFNLEEDKFYKVTVADAYGKWRNESFDDDGIDESILGEKELVICAGANCKCPRGDEPLDDVIELNFSTAKFALAAPPDSTGSIEFREVEPKCCETGDDPGNGPYDEMVGVWELDLDEFRVWGSVLGSEDRCEYATSGEARLEIRPSGRFTKTYSTLVKTGTCQFSDTQIQLNENALSGVVNGCISQSRVINGNYRFDVTDIHDGTTGTVIDAGMPVDRADGRNDEFIWAQFGPRNYAEMTESGSVHFPAAGIMKKGGNISLGENPGSYTWIFSAAIEDSE